MEGGVVPSSSSSSAYRECLRNHAASLGSYATDGCGEFTLDDISGGSNSLQCAACGCHRNFHRKVNNYPQNGASPSEGTANTAHELMNYSEERAIAEEGIERGIIMGTNNNNININSSSNNKKRFRTKFSEEQKEKMLGFAEKIGWKLQRISKETEDEVERFCRSVGVSRQVFKVWMHNHKNNSSFNSSNSASNGNASSLTQ
ncbi:hypothetical protein HN51_008975 [Arachis hypogaea]|uniref:ZF-HD dimerization-type domain-containing protein n=2 Tax=Arachis TaxID=3817 RepID=A0A445D149_ARAHY|nr:zinc-finger homeodomain protein 10 [Arachis duranensis]XP_025701399.1 zinc-finger homeodomain protein 10 [Arachis hypogaea]QHO43365.1 Zinc-finger homeodomain protein [Arachis hypogaea]RYR56949.1 hypothetical protein Ahy_A05g022687 [Arachis hypogaea]